MDLDRRLRLRAELDRNGTALAVTGGALAALAALLHAYGAARYGYFRDELYFIACAKHLAWGYVDQPPLVAFAAWLSAPFGYNLIALRLLPAISAAVTVWLAVVLVREFGGGRFAQWLGGVAVLLTPAYLLLGSTLTTTSFEPLSWSLCVYAVVRIVRGGGARWWTILAVSVAFGGYGKYSIALLVAALAVGLIATRERRVLATPWLLVASALSLALLAPNLWWQAAHGWPIFEVLAGDAVHRPVFSNGLVLESRDLVQNATAFLIEQAVYTNVVAVPLWIAGAVAPFRLAPLRDVRFVTVAFVVLLIAAVLLGAKGYYVIGIYAPLFALGAVAMERALPAARTLQFGALVAVGIAAMPLSLPVLGVDALIAYTKALGLTGRDGTPTHLVQPIFAEEFGWDRLARDVAAVYASLPASERAHATVYADTYGDAGALDFFGRRYGLPPAVSTQNTYYLWGPGEGDGAVMIAVGATRIDVLRHYYRSVTLAATSSEPFKWVVEGPAPIYVCRDPVAPIHEFWPSLRWYGA